MNWLIINLKDTPTGKYDLIEGLLNQCRPNTGKRKDQRKEWVETGKMRRREKVWCHENHALFKDLLIEREEEARYLQLQIYKLRAFNNTSVLQKHGKIHIFSLDQIVPWVIGSFEFLTRDYKLFVDWTRLVWATRVVPLYDRDGLPSSRKPKSLVHGRCCTWSWTCLAALDNFDVVCV